MPSVTQPGPSVGKPAKEKKPRSQRDVPVEVKLGAATVFKIGALRYDLSDPFHMAITLPYWGFVAFIGIQFTLLNTIFALLYWLNPGCISNVAEHSFVDAFFFSIETMATVGYGSMVPATTYGHLVASFESVVGIAFTAVATGIIFVRFSRPRSRMMFAERGVLTEHDGKPTLMIRLAYGRTTTLMSCRATLDVMMMSTSKEGTHFRLAKPLKLVRPRMPSLILAWTVMHEIDEHSPLHGLGLAGMEEHDARFIFTIEGRDQQLGIEVHDMATYTWRDVVDGVRYRDIVTFDENKNAHADLRLLSDTVGGTVGTTDDDGRPS